jgi:hypothetical protein
MFRTTVLLLAFTTVGVIPPAAADSGAMEADLRCMAVMAKINQLPDQKHQLESLIGGYYFLGRLQAVAPELNLGESTAAAYNRMSAADFLSETTRCEQEMRTNGHAMAEIGGAMPKAQPSGQKQN